MPILTDSATPIAEMMDRILTALATLTQMVLASFACIVPIVCLVRSLSHLDCVGTGIDESAVREAGRLPAVSAHHLAA